MKQTNIFSHGIRLIVAFGMLVGLLFLVSQANAQAVRFPIADLDNCRDSKECFLYCEVPSNKPACWAYKAISAGNQVLGVESEGSIVFPVAELGNCANKEECKQFCSIKDNHPACVTFAKTHVMGRYKRNDELLKKAQQELGCPTVAACKSFCQVEANREKCSTFAQKVAPQKAQEEKSQLLGRAKELLGCDSIESCRAFCQKPENKEKCQQLISSESTRMKTGPKQEIQKKLTCTTEAECRKVCEKYPEKCPAFKKALERKNNPYPKPSIFPERKLTGTKDYFERPQYEQQKPPVSEEYPVISSSPQF